MCIPRATVSAVSCLVVPAFICIDLLISRVLKINEDDDGGVRRAIQKVYAMGEFPMSGLAELRDKYASLGSELANVACLAPSPQRNSHFGFP